MRPPMFYPAAAAALSVLSVCAVLAQAPLPLGLMTFNIRTSSIDDGENSWPWRKTLVAQVIERSVPDVVGLQEVAREQVEYLAATLKDYRWLGIDSALNGGEGFSELHGDLLPLCAAEPDRVGELLAVADARRSEPDRAAPRPHCHLGTVPPPRDRSPVLRLQHAFLASAGPGSSRGVADHQGADSETARWKPCDRSWRLQFQCGRKCRLEGSDRGIAPRHMDGRGVTDRPAGNIRWIEPPRAGDTARIDWILVGGAFEVRSAETILFNEAGRYPSDHFPVAARVELR